MTADYQRFITLLLQMDRYAGPELRRHSSSGAEGLVGEFTAYLPTPQEIQAAAAALTAVLTGVGFALTWKDRRDRRKASSQPSGPLADESEGEFWESPNGKKLRRFLQALGVVGGLAILVGLLAALENLETAPGRMR